MRKFIFAFTLACLLMPAALEARKAATVINVIPYPQSVEIGKGTFKGSGATFNCDPAIDARSISVIRDFADKITFITGRTNSFATPPGLAKIAQEGKMKGFIFLKDGNMGPEEYSIAISKKNCIVSASAYNGFLYAIQTLKQLTDVKIFSEEIDPAQKFLFPCVTIKDKPRFAYRGMHLDCARHFFSVEEVKKYLDIMATYKLNRFHWHLTEDQGWRIEIAKYPKLTQIGAFRNGTMVGKDFNSNDGIRYGGYYTKEQMKDIVKYAEDLGITIIPEIDLPGHMLGALAAYPELGCTGGPYEVWTKWGISEDVLCPGKEGMFTFLEDVFTELMEIFPSEYIHIGGDECPKVEWQKCPDCQARIKALGIKGDDKHTAEEYLQSYVTARIQSFLNKHGRKIIGWDEILEGDLAEGATVMSWRGVKGGIQASAQGFDVIMTPNTYCYFDYYQSPEIEKEPLAIGGNLPIEKVYGYEPFEGLDASQQKHILGVQANLWTEYIATPEYLEYMLLPRMSALSEIQWCKPEDKNFDRFSKALHEESFKIYDTMGYNYRKF
ncbi:MAG: beta-N-acetylhexosaminidase [Bacteroidales bacterium]|nr:beta-N-acetylhexosaminidase [Bacteroidales bacterium]